MFFNMLSYLKVSATDNSGKVTLTHDEPPKFKNPGRRTVNYHAKDDSGNQATCTFYVDIVGKLVKSISINKKINETQA